MIWLRGRGSGGNAVHAVSQCRYGLFFDGGAVRFRATDTFVGQVAWLYDYKAVGIPRSEAIAEIKLNNDRVLLAPVLPGGEIGALVEQPLQYSAFKDTHHPTFGRVVYQQVGFMAQLPPGEYVSVWMNQYPGDDPDLTATVHITITG